MLQPENRIPTHPGEVLLEEFLKPMSISQNHLAIKIGVPARRINEIVLAKRRISADTALPPPRARKTRSSSIRRPAAP